MRLCRYIGQVSFGTNNASYAGATKQFNAIDSSVQPIVLLYQNVRLLKTLGAQKMHRPGRLASQLYWSVAAELRENGCTTVENWRGTSCHSVAGPSAIDWHATLPLFPTSASALFNTPLLICQGPGCAAKKMKTRKP